jgi:hypothetical protein
MLWSNHQPPQKPIEFSKKFNCGGAGLFRKSKASHTATRTPYTTSARMNSASLIKLKTTKPIDAHWLCPGSSCRMAVFRGYISHWGGQATSAMLITLGLTQPVTYFGWFLCEIQRWRWVMQKAEVLLANLSPSLLLRYRYRRYYHCVENPSVLSDLTLGVHLQIIQHPSAHLNFPRASAIRPTLCPSIWRLSPWAFQLTLVPIVLGNKHGDLLSQMGGIRWPTKTRDQWNSDGENYRCWLITHWDNYPMCHNWVAGISRWVETVTAPLWVFSHKN